MFQHHLEALNMILNEPKYYPIVEVDLKKFMNKIFEGNHYYPEKIIGAFLSPKGITVYLKQPHSVTKVVLCQSSFAILI